MPRRSQTTRRRTRRPRRSWVHYDDAELLDLRIRDLDLRVERTTIEPRVRKLWDELEQRGIGFRPHVWLSSEWFSPDGVPGIGIPFYLAHPRLMKLEQRQMFEVEGGSQSSCMRILRHEAGHAIDTAYRLHYRKRWREIFGRYTERYPTTYSPRPASKKFVVHLPGWYAQAHPAEDFAETFAVWLAPRSNWRRQYRNWSVALAKLEYVDGLMREISGRRPALRSRAHIEPVSRDRRTLREHYVERRRTYATEPSGVLNRDLLRLFSDDERYAGRPTAVSFLRGIRRELRDTVAEWTGHHPYTIDQVLLEIIEQCKKRRLRLARARHQAKTHALMLVTTQTMRSGRYEIAL